MRKKVYVLPCFPCNEYRAIEVVKWYKSHGYSASTPMLESEYATPDWFKCEHDHITEKATSSDILYIVNEKDRPLPIDMKLLALKATNANVKVEFDYTRSPSETIAIIGSTRFEAEMHREANCLRRKFYIVTLPMFEYHRSEMSQPEFKEKVIDGVGLTKLELLHNWNYTRIDDADYVYVVDVDGYTGTDTKREIKYCQVRNKKLLYYSDDEWRNYVHRE